MNIGVTMMFSPITLRWSAFLFIATGVIFSELVEAFKTFSDKRCAISASSIFLEKLIKSYQGIVTFSQKEKNIFLGRIRRGLGAAWFGLIFCLFRKIVENQQSNRST